MPCTVETTDREGGYWRPTFFAESEDQLARTLSSSDLPRGEHLRFMARLVKDGEQFSALWEPEVVEVFAVRFSGGRVWDRAVGWRDAYTPGVVVGMPLAQLPPDPAPSIPVVENRTLVSAYAGAGRPDSADYLRRACADVVTGFARDLVERGYVVLTVGSPGPFPDSDEQEICLELRITPAEAVHAYRRITAMGPPGAQQGAGAAVPRREPAHADAPSDAAS